MLIYDKLFKLLAEKGYNTTRIRNENLIGQATYYGLKKGGNLEAPTINRLCRILNCQPGDIMEYIPDDEKDGPQDSGINLNE